MERNKKNLREKGITLVALIITIIVMLILVAVTVTVAVESNLIEVAETAGDKYKEGQTNQIQANDVTIEGYGTLEDYIAKLNIKYLPIYEGEATTSDGIVQLSTENIFKSNWLYKIAIESNEFEGTVETVAIYGDEQEGVLINLLCVIAEGEAITFSSREDADAKIAKLNEIIEKGTNVTGIVGMYSSELGSCIMLEGASCEYTITKVEIASPSNMIFEGEIEIENGAELPVSLDISKKYGVTFEYNENIYYRETETIIWDSKILLMVGSLDDETAFTMGGNRITHPGDGGVLTNIYEIGPSETYVEENGFVLILDCGEWTLVDTPDTSYIVPSFVAGKPVEMVYADSIKGEPTFDRPVRLSAPSYNSWAVNYVKIATENYEFIFNFDPGFGITELDLSECGADVQIPTYFLESSYGISKIYVSPAVKANYTAYDKVVAK